MFTEEIDLTLEQQQEARMIAIRAVDVKFTSAEHMQEWFSHEAGGHEQLALFSAYLLAWSRQQAEVTLLESFLSDLVEALDKE